MVSHYAIYLAGIIGTVVLVAIVAWSVRGVFDRPIAAPVEVAPQASQFADMMKLAETGDPVAEHEVARRLAGGEGVPKDEAGAWKWLDRSARHGHLQAQYELGLVLRDGRGAVQDYGAARTWLEKAAERGHPQAQFEIGLMYREGTVVPADPVKAYIWLNVAASRGLSAAAPVRDAVVERLTPDQVVKAQAEARRLVETFK